MQPVSLAWILVRRTELRKFAAILGVALTGLAASQSAEIRLDHIRRNEHQTAPRIGGAWVGFRQQAPLARGDERRALASSWTMRWSGTVSRSGSDSL